MIIFSCNPNEKKIQITLNPIEFNVESIGISSDLPFPFHCEKDKLIIYSAFSREFHELDLKTKNSRFLQSLNSDERLESSELVSFIYLKGDFVLLESNSITVINDKEIKKTLLKNLSVIGNDTINIDDYILANNSEFGNSQLNSNFNSNSIFLGLEEKRERITSFLVEFDLKNPTEIIIRKKINTDETYLQKIFLQKNGMFLNNQTMPFFSLFKENIIISNTFQSDFYFGSSKNLNLRHFSSNSENFENEKTRQKLKKDELSDFLNKIKAWNSDVSFGPILPIYGSEYFFRIVKGKSEKINPFDGVLYFECFDKEFNKISEEPLNVVDKDLTTEYFSSTEGIFLKRTSENENLLKYYKLSVNLK